jgi:hypothetical protein
MRLVTLARTVPALERALVEAKAKHALLTAELVAG